MNSGYEIGGGETYYDSSYAPADEKAYQTGEYAYQESAMDNSQQSMNTTRDESSNTVSAWQDNDKKIFVGGLLLDTSEDDIGAYFSQFGTVRNINIKTNEFGRSRGFAFVTFQSAEVVHKVLESSHHTINGKIVEAKQAKSRSAKIFVGGITANLTEERLRTHFSSFGPVSEFIFPTDKNTNTHRPFCFITFDSESDVREILREGKTMLDGVQLGVKRYVSKEEQQMQQQVFYGYGDPYSGYAGYDYGYYGDYNYGMPASYGYMNGVSQDYYQQQPPYSQGRSGGHRGGGRGQMSSRGQSNNQSANGTGHMTSQRGGGGGGGQRGGGSGGQRGSWRGRARTQPY